MALELATTRVKSSKPPLEKAPRIFSDQEKRAVVYFYGQLKAIYTNQYDALFKDARMIEASKRTWAERLIGYTQAQMDKGLAWIKDQQESHVDGWEFCSIGRCVGAIKAANEVKACHKPFIRAKAITDQGAIDRAKTANKTAMENLRELRK